MVEKKAASMSTSDSGPFLITSEDRLGFILFRRIGIFKNRGLNGLTDISERCRTKIKHRKDWKKSENILPGQSRTLDIESEVFRHFIQKMSLGVLGGVAIIVPMLIMALVNDLTTPPRRHLRCHTFLRRYFGYTIFGGDLDGQAALGAVAAYAAILVVFVGTSFSVTSI